MKVHAIIAGAGIAVSLCAAAPAAHAYPVRGAPELTHNELYKQPKPPKVACAATKGRSRSSVRKYITKVVGCLNKAWGKTTKEFTPATVEITYDAGRGGYCLTGQRIAESFAAPCMRGIQVQLKSDWIRAKDDTAILIELTRAYGGFLQNQKGISEAFWALPHNQEGDELEEQTHRYYLQADCLSGVSMRSLGRTAKNWKPLLDAESPRELKRFRWHGKPANRLYWFTQGYTKARPGACNTWKAPSPKVA
jgi:Predicted metalloprotease